MSNPNKILLAGAFFYFFLAPFFYHPDIKIIYHHSQFLSRGVFNIYSYLDGHKSDSTLGQFVYPPLTYFFFGVIFPIISLLAGPGFTAWLGTGNILSSTPHLFRYLFAMKFPLILAHLLAGYLLSRRFKDAPSKCLTLLLWLFNPVSIYIVALMGQFDILPAVFSLLSLVLFGSSPFIAAVMLGLGAGFKAYPLLLIPFLVAAHPSSWPKRLALLAAGIIPYLLVCLPFIRTPAFITNAFSSGLTTRLFTLSLPIGFNQAVFLLPLLFVILFLYFWYHHPTVRLSSAYLAVTLLTVFGIYFHPQWAMWALPFIVIFLVSSRAWLAGILMLIGWLGVTFTFTDVFLSWGLLSSLEPQSVFVTAPSSLLPVFLSWSGLFHTLVLAVAVWIIIREFNHHV